MLPPRMNVRLDTSLETLLERAPAKHIARVLATVVSTTGSTYRKPGARMLIMADGSYLGLLSGGCLEADLKLHAEEVMASGRARAVEYDMRGPDDILFGIGAGCEGAMRVLLEPAGVGSGALTALETSELRVRNGGSTVLVAVHESAAIPLGTYADCAALPPLLARAAAQTLSEGVSRMIDTGDERGRTRALAQFLAPAPQLLICGAGPDARPVAAAAHGLGWRVMVVDHRPFYALPSHFPGAHVELCEPRALRDKVDLEQCHAAVVMSHHLASDAAYLRALAQGPTPGYIGLLGPERRRARLAQEIGAAADALRSRLHGPVGIDIGAVTPEGIALAIVSQVHAWLAGRGGAVGVPRTSFA